ncbi:MAG: hypothetical protein V1862_04535 [Methanobacteriota archaeon]
MSGDPVKLQELITEARKDHRRGKLRENQQRYYERNGRGSIRRGGRGEWDQ